jgi:hypothetical protein
VWQFEQYLEQVTENLIFDELADEGQLFLGENEDVSKRSNKHLEHLIVRDFVFEFPLQTFSHCLKERCFHPEVLFRSHCVFNYFVDEVLLLIQDQCFDLKSEASAHDSQTQ